MSQAQSAFDASEQLLAEVFAYLETEAEDVYLVGGSLRQLLLNKPIKDYDFVVPGQAIQLAKQLARRFKLSFFPLDKERDMARVILPQVELDFAPYGDNLASDLRLRDITINAMACPVTKELLTGHVQGDRSDAFIAGLSDPCQGLSDLNQGLIRGVSYDNFVADPLRLLRVYRFAAWLAFRIDSQTETWVKELAPLLRQVAAERILQEFQQILLRPGSAAWLRQMDQVGLLVFLPSPCFFDALEAFEVMSSEQKHVHSGDKGDAKLAYLEAILAAGRPRLFVVKLASLCLSADRSSGRSLDLLTALTLSRKELDSLLLWQKWTGALLDLLEQPMDPIAQRFELFRHCKEDILGLVLLGRVWCRLGLSEDRTGQLDILWQEWLNPASPIAHPPLLLDGNRLMQKLQLKPGPLLGQLLLAIQRQQAYGRIHDQAEALGFARDWILAQTEG